VVTRGSDSSAPALPAAASLRRIRQALASREITAPELIKRQLEAAESSRRAVKAFSAINCGHALKAATESEQRYRNGTARLLEGLPIAIKDLIDTKDLDTCYGSAAYLGHRPAADADIVRALLDQGAIIIGKTATHEFAWGVTTASVSFGDTRNPLDPSRIPGGSSGGAAAAIAHGAVAAGVGTDTGGSVRIPAALCGVVGFKPTIRLLPTGGVFPLSATCDHVGLLGRQVDDVVCLSRALNVEIPESDAWLAARLGVVREIAPVPLADDVAAVFDHALQRLTQTFSCVNLNAPHLFDGVFNAFSAIVLIEGGIEHFRRNDWSRIATHYSPETIDRLRRAQAMDMRAYATAQQTRRRFIANLHEAMSAVDYLVLPTCPCTAPPLNASNIDIGGWTGTVREALMTYTAPFNIAGFPAISIPLPSGSQRLPASLQLVARPGNDGALLRIAQQIEAIVRGDSMARHQ